MHRRSAVRALGATVVAATAGCLTSVDEPRSSTTGSPVDPSAHAVSVTRRIENTVTGLKRVFHASDGGSLSVELTCPDGTTKTASGDAPDDEWASFERRVVSTDVTAFKDVYECEGECPTDAPPTHLEFDVDGTITEVTVEPTADRPDALDAILNDLDALASHVNSPTCE